MNLELTPELSALVAAEIAKQFLNQSPQGVKPHPETGNHVIVRTYSAGVHYGVLDSANGKEVTLSQARRIWKWVGAFTLSEVACNGIENNSRVSIPVTKLYLTEAIEIIPVSPKAQATIEACHE